MKVGRTSQGEPCSQDDPDGPVLVTAECVDAEYSKPIIVDDERLSAPVPLRKIAGRFDGTEARFNVYLPTDTDWEHRFHQLVYPLLDENASDETITFAAASGAYVVQTNNPGGYRIDAAAAKFAKTLASDHYGSSTRVYGYIFGGSGGGYQTIGALENTIGVWDGGIPMVIGVPTSIPSTFFVKAFARFVLHEKSKLIADAIRPGGSGDPYAGLDADEAAVLREVTTMGVPLRAWEDPHYLLGFEDSEGLMGFAGAVKLMDPGYCDDFWNAGGYLGTEQSTLGDLFRAARTPQNEWELALLTYHRHQVSKRPGYPPHDQFRTSTGEVLYPQRGLEIGPIISGQVCGTGSFPTHTGALRAKVILLQNMVDPDAFAADADWYRSQVEHSLGGDYGRQFRLWFTDHADHHAGPVDTRRQGRLVSYSGVLQQALRDLAAWVEDGAPPPASTQYQVVDGQVRLPGDASLRGGIQPVVEVSVGGGAHSQVDVGGVVGLFASVAAPDGGGPVVDAEWDYGDGRVQKVEIPSPTRTLHLHQEVSYALGGTYFPLLRVTSQRSRGRDEMFAQVQNIGRVRIEVRTQERV